MLPDCFASACSTRLDGGAGDSRGLFSQHHRSETNNHLQSSASRGARKPQTRATDISVAAITPTSIRPGRQSNLPLSKTCAPSRPTLLLSSPLDRSTTALAPQRSPVVSTQPTSIAFETAGSHRGRTRGRSDKARHGVANTSYYRCWWSQVNSSPQPSPNLVRGHKTGSKKSNKRVK